MDYTPSKHTEEREPFERDVQLKLLIITSAAMAMFYAAALTAIIGLPIAFYMIATGATR